MKLPLSKSGAKRLSGSFRTRFQGVSIDYLIDLNDRIFAGLEAKDIQLFVSIADFEADMINYTLSVKAGDTVSFIAEISPEKWQGSIAGVGVGTFNPRILRPKVREDWTLNDVREYALKQLTKPGCAFIDTLNPGYVGESNRGAIVLVDGHTCFSSLINALGLHFDQESIDVEDRFAWIDCFCSPSTGMDEKQSSRYSKEVASAFGKFSSRLMFYAVPKAMNGAKVDHELVSTEIFFLGHPTTVYIEKELLEKMWSNLSLFADKEGLKKEHFGLAKSALLHSSSEKGKKLKLDLLQNSYGQYRDVKVSPWDTMYNSKGKLVGKGDQWDLYNPLVDAKNDIKFGTMNFSSYDRSSDKSAIKILFQKYQDGGKKSLLSMFGLSK